MSSKPKVDSSWHERGEFPPAGCECEVIGDVIDGRLIIERLHDAGLLRSCAQG